MKQHYLTTTHPRKYQKRWIRGKSAYPHNLRADPPTPTQEMREIHSLASQRGSELPEDIPPGASWASQCLIKSLKT